MCRLYSIKMEHRRYLGKRKTFSLLFHEFHFFLVAFSRKEKICVDLLNCMHGKKGTLLHNGWKFLKKVLFYNIATNLMPPFWGCPQKRRHQVSNWKWDIFGDFIPLCYYFQAKQNWKVGFWNGTLKSFFVKPTTFEGHLMRHLHKFGQ